MAGDANPAAGTVDLFGSRVKKGYVIAGGLVVVVAVLYGFYKNKAASGTSSGPASGTAASAASGTGYGAGLAGAAGTDPYPADGTVGNPSDPNSTDPATGQTYGDEGAFGAGYSGYGWGGGYGGGAGGYTGTPGTYTTNGEWAQAAEQYLTGTVGASATTVAAAMGKYISGQPLTQAQVSVVQQAIAFTGYPPQSGPAGDPPGYQLAPEPPPQPQPKPPVQEAVVPNVLHQPQEAAYAIVSEAGLHPQGSPVIHGKVIYVVSQSPKAGTRVPHGTTVHLVSKV